MIIKKNFHHEITKNYYFMLFEFRVFVILFFADRRNANAYPK